MSDLLTIKTLDEIVVGSKATPAFKEAVLALAGGAPSERIEFNRGAPPVKVMRFIMKLMEELTELEIESVSLQGSSGCSNFSGKAVVEPGEVNINFVWDCAWRARQQGWVDALGDPDQIRAARTLGYQCFQKFEVAQ